MLKKLAIGAGLATALAASSCVPEADVASRNVSMAAANFEVNRRIIFYNGITDSYMLTIEGRCSLGNNDDLGELTVTCKTGSNRYLKHFLGLSDNVTYFVEQLDAAEVSGFHYRVVFRPQSIIPDVDFQGSVEELVNDAN